MDFYKVKQSYDILPFFPEENTRFRQLKRKSQILQIVLTRILRAIRV